MVALPGWARRRRVQVLAVTVAAVVAGGTLLGLELSGSSQAPSHPSTAAGGGGTTGGDVTDSGTGGAGSGAEATGAGTTSTTLAPLKVAAICTVVTGNLNGTITLGDCSQLQATGGTGTFPGAALTRSGSTTVSWNGTGTTTFVYVSSHPVAQRRKCAGDDTETTLKGSVTANAPVGAGNAGVKGAIHAKLCVDPRLNVSLAPGRAFQI